MLWRLLAKINFVTSALILAVPAYTVHAADLKIGFKAEVTSADPHVLNGNNRNVWVHVYESLVAQDENLKAKPALATSWRNVDSTTWEFKLRPNVTFHNGATMTAEDVKFSIERAMNLSGPRTFRTYLKAVQSVTVTGPGTVTIKTKGPSPTLPDSLGLIAILPKTIGDKASEEDFATGKTTFGTGPYKFVSWAHGQRVSLAKNSAYWGEKEPWDNVTFQFIPREPARASALLSGSVDLIDAATANVMDSFKSSNKIDVVSTTSYMLNYLQLDRFRDNSPYLKSNEGAPLAKNPFNDIKVRQALMAAVNREGIVNRLMKGDAEAASQFVPAGFFGNDPALKVPAHDLAKAKALLAEAGYPNGFRMTMHCSNDRYLNDAKVCEALGQVFSQIGIKTEVATMPFAVYAGRATAGGASGEPEFSLFMFGIGAVTGDSLEPLLAVAHSHDKAAGLGANNRGRYSSKEVDALVIKASVTMNEKAREDLQKAAAKAVIDDVGIVPLFFLKSTWAYRKGLTVKPRSDGFTLAMGIRESSSAK
ncbi:ABC transporter substrate-binding protein [Noviherbaspirillum saxi]|uniref:ABC transporter substrate-binding protein n=2 Tax=Noviherbaspirillum saxi TaxID=2320863 RepID=A0A3A3FHF1_9BURK|nr:ABC transporter substrate-binding protein [Noviherbaspirillum saxi]RJF91934.1 ABC transporter substrate-binding protein [Noviherbaspirillum saxi]